MTPSDWSAPEAYELGFAALAALGEPLDGRYPCEGAATDPLAELTRSDSIAHSDVGADLPLDGLMLGLGLDVVTYDHETDPLLLFDARETSAPVLVTPSGLLVVPWVVEPDVAAAHLAPVFELLRELDVPGATDPAVRVETVDAILSD